MNDMTQLKKILQDEIHIWIITNFIIPALDSHKWVEKSSHLNITIVIDEIIRELNHNEYARYLALSYRERINIFRTLCHRFADELIVYYACCHIYKELLYSPYAYLRYSVATQVPDLDLAFGSKSRPEPKIATADQINDLIIQANVHGLPRFNINSNGDIATPSGLVMLKVEATALLDSVGPDGAFPWWVDDYLSNSLVLP